MAEVMTDDPLTISMNKDLENCITLMRRTVSVTCPFAPKATWLAWYLSATPCSTI
jgi:hypothetical protein